MSSRKLFREKSLLSSRLLGDLLGTGLLGGGGLLGSLLGGSLLGGGGLLGDLLGGRLLGGSLLGSSSLDSGFCYRRKVRHLVETNCRLIYRTVHLPNQIAT